MLSSKNIKQSSAINTDIAVYITCMSLLPGFPSNILLFHFLIGPQTPRKIKNLVLVSLSAYYFLLSLIHFLFKWLHLQNNLNLKHFKSVISLNCCFCFRSGEELLCWQQVYFFHLYPSNKIRIYFCF